MTDDLISRAELKRRLQEHHDFFVNAYGGFSNLPPNDKSRVDEITNCIAEVVNMPSVQPILSENEDCISRKEAITQIQRYGVGCFNEEDFSPEECERFVIGKLKSLPVVTPKEIYNKGWKDGAEATAYHVELCEKENPTIPLSVIEDIKEEIKREEFTHHDGFNHYYMTPEEMKVILFEIIDKHIKERGKLK